MHSEKAAKGQRALHPAQEYCHLCRQKKPAHHRQELSDGQSPPLEPILRSHVWKEYLPLPFPVDLETLDDRAGNHNHHDLQRRQVCLGQSHYTLSESCSPPCYMWREMRVPRWDPWLPSSTCVWDRSALAHCGQEVADGRVADRLGRPSDYSYGREWYHHEPPHPLNGGPMLAKVRSQRYYREARNVSEEHHLDCVSENFHQNRQIPELEWDHRRTFEYNGHCERRHVTFEDHDHDGHSIEYNGPTSPIKNHCNGDKAFFSTEVPQSKFTVSKTSGPKLPVSEIYGGETKLDQADRSEVGGSQSDHRKSQETVREQIKQVVTELEDVLSGLKQVQMEMKEVVQQIDVLTSSIDLGEEEQGPFNGLPQESMHQANRIGVVALVHNANRNAESIQSVHMCAGVKSQTSRSLSDHNLAPVISCPESHPTTKIHTNPSSRVHAPMTVESAYSNQMNHTSVLEIQRTKGTANGDCLRARPPRAKVKELQHQKNKTDYTKNPDPPYPLAPISLAKTQRPPPYPQNGLVKVPSKDLNVLKTPPYPGKQKELTSTMV